MTERPLTAGSASRAMVEAIAAEAAETAEWTGFDAFSPSVMAAMAEVPRHLFVDPAQRPFAYENRPLPIGHGQTISQPYIVALICELAAIGPGDKVLEVGTGCGYQAAVIAELGAEVVTVERIDALAEGAAGRLDRLGYDRITVHCGDGSLGWPADAPYDAVVVTAAAFDDVPPALVAQLAVGGRLVIPVERPGGWNRLFAGRREQELLLLVKKAEDEVSRRSVLPVAFVPLISG